MPSFICRRLSFEVTACVYLQLLILSAFCALPMTSIKQYAMRSALRRLYSSRDHFPTTTNVNVIESTIKIEHLSKLTLIGSCFSETIGSALKRHKFDVISNPQGILFNPISIADCLENTISCRSFDQNDIYSDVIERDICHSWSHHSSYSDHFIRMESMIARMNHDIVQANRHLYDSDLLFITLGTARVHFLTTTGQVVANCHKQPGNMFSSRVLSVDEIITALGKVFENLITFNPKLQICLTVSPVRHTRDGMVENARSKAALLVACHDLVDKFRSSVTYFPSYEIMTDELRDYRWYSEDLVHPSSAAQELIFRRFMDTYFSAETKAIVQSIQSVLRDIEHKPHIPDSAGYKRHLQRTVVKLAKLQSDLQLDFSVETTDVEKNYQHSLRHYPIGDATEFV